jgi:DNA-binding MarR family transcriptional regulator
MHLRAAYTGFRRAPLAGRAGRSDAVTQKFEFADYLPYLVNRVGAALVERFTADALAREHLTIAMWRVLATLSGAGEQRQIDLADMTTIDVSTLSRLVTRLVGRGLVTRQRSTVSNREVTVALTPKGIALVRRLIPIAAELERIAIAGLPAKEVAALKRTLRRVHANLE